jgi:coproporphyrinogen III oxidase
MPIRYLEKGDASWLAARTDPYYPYSEDAVHFHQTLKTVCDQHDPDHYPFKMNDDISFSQW